MLIIKTKVVQSWKCDVTNITMSISINTFSKYILYCLPFVNFLPIWFSTGAQICTGARPVLTSVAPKKLAEDLKFWSSNTFSLHPPDRCPGVVGRTLGTRKVKMTTIWTRGSPNPTSPIIPTSRSSPPKKLHHFTSTFSCHGWRNHYPNMKSLCITHVSFVHVDQRLHCDIPPALSSICRIVQFYNHLLPTVWSFLNMKQMVSCMSDVFSEKRESNMPSWAKVQDDLKASVLL